MLVWLAGVIIEYDSDAGLVYAQIFGIASFVGIGILAYRWLAPDIVSKMVFSEINERVNREMYPTKEELEEVRKNWPAGYMTEGGIPLSFGTDWADTRAWRTAKVNRLTAEELVARGYCCGIYEKCIDMYILMYKDFIPEVACKRAEHGGFIVQYNEYIREGAAIALALAPDDEQLAEFSRRRYGKEAADKSRDKILKCYREVQAIDVVPGMIIAIPLSILAGLIGL